MGKSTISMAMASIAMSQITRGYVIIHNRRIDPHMPKKKNGYSRVVNPTNLQLGWLCAIAGKPLGIVRYSDYGIGFTTFNNT